MTPSWGTMWPAHDQSCLGTGCREVRRVGRTLAYPHRPATGTPHCAVFPRTRRLARFAPYRSGCWDSSRRCGSRHPREAAEYGRRRTRTVSAHSRADQGKTRILKYQPRCEKATEKGSLTAIAPYVKHNDGADSGLRAPTESGTVGWPVGAPEAGAIHTSGGGRWPRRVSGSWVVPTPPRRTRWMHRISRPPPGASGRILSRRARRQRVCDSGKDSP